MRTFIFLTVFLSSLSASLARANDADNAAPNEGADVSTDDSAEAAGDAGPQFVGFADARGGRGGNVLRVTNLAAKGPGSLRAALEAKGPRIIVFEVGGVIDLDGTSLSIAEPFVTVAGQTAPPPGITLLRGGIYIQTHHVVVRHLAVRPGDAGRPKRSGWEPDGISTVGGAAHDIVIDHCSLTWAVDENLSASGPATKGPDATSHRVTFSNCILAEGLHNASHKKGPHSKGTLIHDFCRDIAVVGNLYAHNVRRNPWFKGHTTGVIVNNVVYNPGTAAMHLGFVPHEWRDAAYEPRLPRVSIVGNVLLAGANTRKGRSLVWGAGEAYLADNLAFDPAGKPAKIARGRIERLKDKPVWPRGLRPLPAEKTVDYVLAHAGARPAERDLIDRRIVRTVRQRTGEVIDSQEQVGGYPRPKATRRKLDVPAEGVQAWLDRLARALEAVVGDAAGEDPPAAGKGS